MVIKKVPASILDNTSIPIAPISLKLTTRIPTAINTVIKRAFMDILKSRT